MIRKIGLRIGGLFFTMPEAAPDDSDSEQWLRPGPFSVGMDSMEFIDESQETAANNDAPPGG